MADPEERRLAALLEYGLLDTPSEAAFDNITRLASQICGTPVALISLVDDRRQWFKSRQNFEVTETPRELSFCKFTILSDEVFEVPDARADARFRDNPLLEGDRGVIFYAGAPLTTPEGERVGTLCVIDHQPHQLTFDQKRSLRALAEQVMNLFEARRATHKFEQKEREAAQSRLRLLETLQAMPVGVAFLEGPEHRYSFVNARHAAYFPDRTDFVGQTVAEALPEFAATQILRKLDEVYQTGKPFFADEMPTPFVQPDGSTSVFYLTTTYQPLRDTAGRVEGIVVTLVDATGDVRRREDLVAKNALILETQRLLSEATRVARVGFFEFRVQDNVVTFSEQMQADWGIAAGGSVEDVMLAIHDDDREGVRQKVERAIASGDPYFAQYRIVRAGVDGHVWIEAQGQCTYDATGAPISLIGTSIDITSRKAIERDAQAVANSIPQQTWVAEPSGLVIWYNQRWFEYTGTTMDQMRGLGWKTLIRPDYAERVATKYLDTLAADQAWEDVLPLRGADGQYRWFLSRAVPLRDDAGRVVRWFGSNTDITAQRESDRQVARLAAVVESTQDFVGLTDLELRPIFLNQAGRRRTGFGDRDLNTTTLFDFFIGDDRAVVRDVVLPALAREGYWEGELHFRHLGTGERFPVLFNLFPVRDREFGDLIGYGTVTRDISERTSLEVHLREAKEAAERANGAKSVFLANMSHEIRSPLGAIMGFSDLIKNTELKAEEFANFIAVIDRNSHHLLRIVDDILDLSKVEAGKMLIEHIEFSLTDLLSDVTSLMRFRARDKGIDFQIELTSPIPEHVRSDPTRLRQILNNLVGNAIKFTERGSVRLAVSFAAPNLELTVRDTGSGIPPDQAEQLFQPFQQADVSTTRKFGGTGLGLALTRRLAEAMGGGLSLVESSVGAGSVFMAVIAVDPGASTRMVGSDQLNFVVQKIPVAPAALGLTGLRILVIDDSPDNQDLFRLMLTRLGAEIEIARDGIEGVDAALAGDFDVVLCDVQMPRMDGYAATRTLHQRGYTRPIVALTAHAMREERDRALASGFSDFLSKPVNRDALVNVILRWAPDRAGRDRAAATNARSSPAGPVG